MRNYLRELLAPHHHVITASNGVEALSIIEKEKPELVLTDVMMPQLDGFGLLKAIRSNPETSAIKVIMLSARAGEESQVEGLGLGADDYLVKPFTARELLARVDAHIAMSRSRLAAAAQERQLRAEIEKQQEVLNAALAASETGTFSWDPAREEYLHFDDNLRQLFGIPPSGEPVNRTEAVLGRIHPDDLPRFLAEAERSNATGSFEAEYRVNLPDGSVRWLYDKARLERNGFGHGYFIGACTNITEKKLAEQALIQSEKLASVGRLAATVAHEINNPLEAATNLLYLAQNSDSLPTPVAGYLKTAEEELSRVAEIARQTLGFYREQNAPVPTQVGEMLKQLKRLFSRKAKNKHIDMQVEIREDPRLVASPSELRQLFANLIGNSLDAVENHGKIRIRLSTWKDEAHIMVADSGPGIPPAIRRHIFEPFFTTKKDVGTGLGLWVSKNIVDKHGGRIRVHSSTTPGQSGTAILISLPAGKKPAAA